MSGHPPRKIVSACLLPAIRHKPTIVCSMAVLKHVLMPEGTVPSRLHRIAEEGKTRILFVDSLEVSVATL